MKIKLSIFLVSLLFWWSNVASAALVAYYPFNGNANDLINGNNGTIYGATLSTDRYNHPNSSYAFIDTDHDYINAPNPSSLGISNAITIAAWVFIGTYRDTNFQTVQKDGTSQLHAFAMPILGNDGVYYQGALQAHKFGLELTLNGVFKSGMWSTTQLSAGTWNHLAATYDSSSGTAKLYLNGRPDKTVTGLTGAIQQNDKLLNIGRFGGENRDYFNGKLYDIRIYNEALSDSQVLNLVTKFAPGNIMLMLLD
jgi:Concanavalin A-like lectin/glucanases superfamily